MRHKLWLITFTSRNKQEIHYLPNHLSSGSRLIDFALNLKWEWMSERSTLFDPPFLRGTQFGGYVCFLSLQKWWKALHCNAIQCTIKNFIIHHMNEHKTKHFPQCKWRWNEIEKRWCDFGRLSRFDGIWWKWKNRWRIISSQIFIFMKMVLHIDFRFFLKNFIAFHFDNHVFVPFYVQIFFLFSFLSSLYTVCYVYVRFLLPPLHLIPNVLFKGKVEKIENICLRR